LHAGDALAYHRIVQKLRPILSALIGGALGVAVLLVLWLTMFQKDESTAPPIERKPRAQLPSDQTEQPPPALPDDEAEPATDDPAAPPDTPDAAGPTQPPPTSPTSPDPGPDLPPTEPATADAQFPNPADSKSKAELMLAALEPMDLSAPAASTGTAGEAIRRGNIALKQNHPDVAEAHFREALKADETNPDALAGLAMALLMAGKHEESIPVYWDLIGVDPHAYNAYHNLALALVRSGQRMEAERVYLLLLDRKPDFIEGRANLATLYQARGRLADAARHWRKVLELDPERPDAWANLGEVLIDLGDMQKSMEAYAEAAKLQPNNASAWLNYAAAAQAVGSGGRAIVALNRAIELAPQDAEAWRMLGDTKLQIYRARNDQAMLKETIAAWEKSLQLQPDQPQLTEQLNLYAPMVKD
jgi:tetratricopeptide (TPR) repeat protein